MLRKLALLSNAACAEARAAIEKLPLTSNGQFSL